MELREGYRGFQANRRMLRAPIDSRITYPCYKSLDEFIDIARLKSLDDEMREGIHTVLEEKRGGRFYTGGCKMNPLDKARPGGAVIRLTRAKTTNYFAVNDPEMWYDADEQAEFPQLMDFIRSLPFKTMARMVIMCDEQGRHVTAHRDHSHLNLVHEFIWFRTNLDKRLCMIDPRTKQRNYVDSYSAWFDTVNQFHSADAAGTMTFSVRVDGVFSDALRAQIPTPECNAASTAALWASLTG